MFELKLAVYIGTLLFWGPKLQCLSVEEHWCTLQFGGA